MLADENFDRDITRGLLRHHPQIVVVRVQDVGLRQADDRTVLTWAGEHGFVLRTYDRATVPPLAYERVANGQTMPGVLLVSTALAVGAAIEEIALVVECMSDAELQDRVYHLPL